MLVLAAPAMAEKGKLRERLTPEVMAAVYPGAERLGDEEGNPPAIAVYKGDKVVAYVFSTLDIIQSRGYSTTPFDVIGGVDLGGHITGAKVVFHAEPIIVHDVVRERELADFMASEAGRSLASPNTPPPDYMAGATISTRAMHSALLATARLVLRRRAARTAQAAPAPPAVANPAVTNPAAATAPATTSVPPSTAPTATVLPPDLDTYSPISFDELLALGAVVRRRVTSGEVAAALAAQGASGAKLDTPLGRDNDLYIDFMTALVTPAAIGGNLLGMVKLEEYQSTLPDGADAIVIASRGPYDFIGKKYFRESEGYRFDRIRISQDGKTFGFVQRDYTFAVLTGGDELAGLFVIPRSVGFDPQKPWHLDVLVNGDGPPMVSIPFGVDYKLPDLSAAAAALAAAPPAPVTETPPAASVKAPEPPAAAPEAQPAPPLAGSEPEPEAELDLPPPVAAWVEAWSNAKVNIAILAVLLSALTAIFVFQDRLARSRRAHRLVRNAFLLFVLVWLGWTAGVQLSIVNIMNYATAPFGQLDLGFYLAEPLMVIIAGYTLVSVVLIGRGVFCGWLCPFGALQELLGQLSRALGVPQWHPPAALEKRLWMGKYIAAAAVIVLTLTQIDPTGAATELEPFKTAITTKFTRAWPFVLYAGGLLAIGLFSERAYCRFLCPLGGVLATLDRLHLLDLLKRRPECGSPCRLCERACPVRAIEQTGRIVTAECFQCLDCQVEYFDDKRCPPLVRAAKLRDMSPVAATVPNV